MARAVDDFFDEIDSIMARSCGHWAARVTKASEGSRRTATEVLIQMDGLSNKNSSDMVLVLAASNLPWELDVALLKTGEAGLGAVARSRREEADGVELPSWAYW